MQISVIYALATSIAKYLMEFHHLDQFDSSIIYSPKTAHFHALSAFDVVDGQEAALPVNVENERKQWIVYTNLANQQGNLAEDG